MRATRAMARATSARAAPRGAGRRASSSSSSSSSMTITTSARSTGRARAVARAVPRDALAGRSFESELAPLRAAGIEVHRLGARALSQGDCAPEVCALQAMLASERLLALPNGGLPTGFFGPSTTEAVKKWQKVRGIEPTGVFGDASREAYLAQKKTALFASVFGPQPPSRAWLTAEKFGKPIARAARTGTWTKEAYLSANDVFAASFLSGVLFTVAILFQHKARNRWKELEAENRRAGVARTRGELVSSIVRECLDDASSYFRGIFDRARGKLATGAAFRARSPTPARRRFFLGGFALRLGNWRVGSWD